MVRQYQDGYSQILITKSIIQWKMKGPLRNMDYVYDISQMFISEKLGKE